MLNVKAVRKDTEWRVYKPRKNNEGSASKLQMKVINGEKPGKDGKTYKVRKVQLFWVSAKQTGTDKDNNASFGWEDDGSNITIKLGEPDIGEILACLNGIKKVAGVEDGKFKGIFHQNDKGNTSFLLERLEKDGKAVCYGLRVSKKVGTQAPIAISHQLTFGEASVLKVLLEAALRQMYQW